MWGRFFDSIGHDDNDSVLSGSHAATGSFMVGSPSAVQRSPTSDLHPNDSASVVDDDNGSVLEAYAKKKGFQLPSSVPVPVDDGTYVFKFRTPSGRTHRFQSRHDDIEHLREIVAGKLAIDPFFTEFKPKHEGDEHPDPHDFHLSYTDEDGDIVAMTSDDDVTDAVKIARNAKTDRVVLFLQGGKGWADAADKSEAKAQEVSEAAQKEVKEFEKAEAEAVVETTPLQAPTPKSAPAIPATQPVHHGPEEVFGIPKDLLLPASIGALAVVIIGVFTISRLSQNHY